MSLKIAYFQPTVICIDNIPPVEFSKIYTLVEALHSRPELNDSGNPLISIRGGQQIQIFPNDKLDIDVSWLLSYIKSICQGYLEIITQQAGVNDLKLCDIMINSVWTIRQTEGEYQEMHTHPAGNLSGNMYISAPELVENSQPSDSQILFRLPATRDINRFVMTDTWKYSPTPGTVLVFPSHIPHTVYPWRGQGTRTVLAFDARLIPKEDLFNGDA
jgi:hypothetical protein